MEERNNTSEVTLHKIPLEGFIQMLQMLYDNGADYVDIVAKPNMEQDIITLKVMDEYLNPEFNTFEEDTPSSAPPIDLNDLA